jgi:hypothetical protein
MADEALELQDVTSEAPPTRRSSGLMPMIKAGAFVSVIVVVEIVAASMLVPSARDTERLGRQYAAAAAGKAADFGDEGRDRLAGTSRTLREVDLGIFNVTRYNPSTNTTMAIDFALYGTVLAEDLPEFQRLFESNQARVREQIIMTLHGAVAADLTDPGLGLIKRRILEKTNRALGQPLVRELLFSKFNFVER